MLRPQPAQPRQQKMGKDQWGRGDANRASQRIHVCRHPPQGHDLPLDRLGPSKKVMAFHRQRPPPRKAVEEANRQGRLQLTDAARNGRVLDAELARCPGQAAGAGEREEIASPS